ncbi:MAG: hypothetical protein K9H49_04130 [Bacteroidales bacterium]|nr:hypothetical protein [Bacteroidales bacterium]MCF8391535.1 hypothetical protein [Bacteroidales bacterium]
MKIKLNYIAALGALLIAMFVFITACEEEKTVPPLVPVKAEIKQIIINNSVYVIEYRDKVVEDMDTVVIIVPQGTDITNLDVDILYSYFGSIDPLPGITDFSNPVIYTITSNFETRDVMVMVQQVPPSLTSFLITSPVELVGKIVRDSLGLGNDTIKLSIREGIDVSNATFSVNFFGESVIPDPAGKIDLTKDTVIIVTNKEFQSTYVIDIEYYKVIEFTGVIFDGSMHPNSFLPGAINAEDSAFFSVEDDAFATLGGGKVARFINLDYTGNTTGSASFDFAKLGLDANPEAVTVIIRGKGYATHVTDHRYVEINVQMDLWRYQFWVTDDGLDGSGYSNLPYEDIAAGLDPLQWNTYRLTANYITGEVKIYLNEAKDPIPEMMPLFMEPRSDPAWKFSFGDGSGGNSYDGSYDYVIIETGGAYSPDDLSLEKILATYQGTK